MVAREEEEDLSRLRYKAWMITTCVKDAIETVCYVWLYNVSIAQYIEVECIKVCGLLDEEKKKN